MNQPLAWKNGQMMPFAHLSLHASDLGVVAGASITEMARTFQHQPFRIADHIQRLIDSCSELGFSVGFSASELCDVACEIAAANCQLISAKEDLGIVAFVTAGANQTYLGTGELPPPTVAVHTFALPFGLWKPAASSGVSLSIPERPQISSKSLPVHRKVRNRLHWWLADREASQKRPGSRSLLLDENGCLTETSNGCFFAVIDGSIVTPEANVLDSMSRRVVKEGAAHLGIPFTVRSIMPDELPSMTAAFVSSTPFGILPVGSINDHKFDADLGIVSQLAEYWMSLTKVNPLQQILCAGDDKA